MDALKLSLEQDLTLPESGGNAVDVESFTVTDASLLAGKSLKTVDMRNSGCMLIGIERGQETYMNPEPDMVMQEGDVVWLVGEPDAIKLYK